MDYVESTGKPGATIQLGMRIAECGIKAKDILLIRIREFLVPRSEFAVCESDCPGQTKEFVRHPSKFQKNRF
jgi:hypothetical protein